MTDQRRKERISMAKEICSHRGENPGSVDRNGQEGWEKYGPLAGAVIREAERLFDLRAITTERDAKMMPDQSPEGLLRAWAKAYRETPEHRFPSDPHAEFFPVDLEFAATEIARFRAAAHVRPFYGAECPSYPACEGGCGLGCTRDVERAAAPVAGRDKLWHLIAQHIACEDDCQKQPSGCGCARDAADAVLALLAVPSLPAQPAREEVREALAFVVKQADAVYADERNDIQDRRAIRRFADRFRLDSADADDGWAARQLLAALAQSPKASETGK